MKPIFDTRVRDFLTRDLKNLERHFKTDVIFMYGVIAPGAENIFLDFIEDLKKDKKKSNTLTILLKTPGGHAETVEKLVNIMRTHYDEVNFVVPEYAMSAGTIFCMSGDKIFMDYSSSLGPIDPQVYNGKNWVPALGYLEKVNELMNKINAGGNIQAEYLLLRDQDLAMLRSYEQARDLTISLLKEWLVKYKFKNWNTHRTDVTKIGTTVTQQEKQARAEEIARDLNNNGKWLSHGRFIGIETLKNDLRLEIEDYSNDKIMRGLIRKYNDTVCDYIVKYGYERFLHSRIFI